MTISTPDKRQARPARQTKKRLTRIVLAGVAVLVIVAGLGLWWFFRDDAPPEVSLDTATEGLETTTESDDAADSETAANSDAAATSGTSDVSGTWTVDTETGDFDFETATGSFVGFRIEEELNSVGSTTAVGRTGNITGTMVIDGTTVTEASIDIDLTTITTNSSQRDDNVQDALETDQFPSAIFVLTEPIDLGEAATQGDAVSVTANGELTIHGTTQEVTFDLDAQLVDNTVVVVGSTAITFSDYGVEVPTGGPVISVDDFGTLELQLLLNQ